MSRRDPVLTALLCGLSFLAGVCLMDAQSRPAIEALAADNIELSRLPVRAMSTADARWATPLDQIAQIHIRAGDPCDPTGFITWRGSSYACTYDNRWIKVGSISREQIARRKH